MRRFLSSFANFYVQMPKGALLHAHLEATVDASTLLRLGSEYDNMCIRVLECINPANLSRVLPQFGARPVAGQREYMKAPTITDVDYSRELGQHSKSQRRVACGDGGPEWV